VKLEGPSAHILKPETKRRLITGASAYVNQRLLVEGDCICLRHARALYGDLVILLGQSARGHRLNIDASQH